MPNMSYCRFHNTLSDLHDCEAALEDMQENLHLKSNYQKLLKEFEAMKEPDDESSDAWDDWATLAEEVDEARDALERVALSDEEHSKALQLLELCRQIGETYDDDDLLKED